MKSLTLLIILTMSAKECLIANPTNGSPSTGGIVEVSRFGVKPDSGADVTEGVRAALDYCRTSKAAKLIFAPGRYDFWPDRAAEKYLFISNNDDGLKRIGFPLVGQAGLQIDGGGAEFLFHGPMVPFLIEEARNIRIENLKVDFARAFHSEGKVLAVSPETVDVDISEEFPFEIWNGVLVFTGGEKAPEGSIRGRKSTMVMPVGTALAFDPKRRETAYMMSDKGGLEHGVPAEKLGGRRVRLHLKDVQANVGDVLAFGAARRDYPGIVVSDSSDIHLDRVTLHHSGGMGIIAQRSGNLFLDHVRITPSGTRIISTTADATHFTNCFGKLELRDCLFENQLDDATNIHGLYARIDEILAPNRFVARLVHPQQAGVQFLKSGVRLELTHGPSLESIGEVTAESVEPINKELTVVTTRTPLPKDVVAGDSVSDADANTADVLIQDCVIRNNRARGILLGSRGKIRIEGNQFHTPGSAILFEGDARFWFEQAGVRDVTIRGNTFDNCNFGVWGNACISVGSGIAKEFRKSSRYNRNILIEDNLFRTFDTGPLVKIYSVSGLTFHRNRLEKSTAYPPRPDAGSEWFIQSDSDAIKIEEPTADRPSKQ
ncbi:MAG: right-handed parallel beta-helix repeat-containing protein [Verrucomicrobiae bacterium]